MDTLSRPQVARQQSRVPGGFDTDDEFSPIKASFDHDELEGAGWAVQSSPTTATNAVAVEDNSMLTASSEAGGIPIHDEASTLEEREIRRKLMEEDSTFLPPLSPFAGSGRYDTLTTGASLESPNTMDKQDPDQEASQQSLESPSGFYQTPAPGRDYPSHKPASAGSEKSEHNNSSPDTMSSSPTARAVARKPSRTLSITSSGIHKSAHDHAQSPKTKDQAGLEEDLTPRKIESRRTSTTHEPESPTPTKQASLQNPNGEDLGDGSDAHRSPLPSRKRPTFLTTRLSTQKSSFSTYTTVSTEAGSDATLNADYALQTGGAAPFGSSISSRPRMDYSRTTSLGSMASGISGLSDEERIRSRAGTLEGMQTLSEEGPSTVRYEDSGAPETPRVASTSTDIPTDTVLARRVNAVEVPATVAHEYRNRHRSPSPDKRPGAQNLGINRNGRNLTLKEQSGTIDRLTKENFDLKMKITFLNDSLNKRSPEGVAGLVNENADLKASKVTSAKEIRDLKRSIRDLERTLRGKEEELAEALRKVNDEDERAVSGNELSKEVEEELIYLRDRVVTYDVEIEKLRHESYKREGEKRRMAEILQSRRTAASDAGAREEIDMWKDQLEAETARREQADEENRRLREEIWRPDNDKSSVWRNLANGHCGLEDAGHSVNNVGASSASSKTIVEVVEQLRHDNASLRREVAAQMSMLTSRNREKQNLDQEIEELKFAARRDGVRSIAGDSILERSVSRAHGRPASRASHATRMTISSDAERETYESKIADLRDTNSDLKLELQKVTRGFEDCMDQLDQHEAFRAEQANLQQLYEKDLEQAMQDLQIMQADRDETLRMHEELEAEFQNLRSDAEERIGSLEEELGRKEQELNVREDDLEALRGEFRRTSESVVRLEDDMNIKASRIVELEHEIETMNDEMDNARDEYNQLQSKNDRLTVQHESLQKEISFLREEQDTDKIRIGDLQAELTSEKDRVKDLDGRLAQEKHQREVIDSKEKQELQRIMDELNQEVSETKSESRDLKQTVQSREVEVTTFKERLSEWESNLRELFNEPNGTRSSLLASITHLQKELDSTASELGSTKDTLSQKEQLLRSRDALLESHGLESKKLSDLLERERQARRADKAQHEQWQKAHQHTTRTVTQKDQRITELEHSRQADRKKITNLETSFKDKLEERNQLLLTLWNKLAPMCGSDWHHHNALINNHVPTLEVLSSQLPAFSKNLLSAIATVEGLLLGFSGKIKTIERDLWKEYQSLETSLDTKARKLDKLEATVQANRVSGTFSAAPEIAKLRGENRLLKSEIGNLQKQELHARTSRALSSAKSTINNHSTSSNLAAPAPTLARHYSSSAVEHITQPHFGRSASSSTTATLGTIPQAREVQQQSPPQSQPIEPSQQRWIHRLRELERRLKAEREARLLDRTAARKRLEEGMSVNEQLRGELERERGRKVR